MIESVRRRVARGRVRSGRLLRIGDGRVLARGLQRPYALTETADGSIYVVESGDVSRPSGAIARVAGDGTVVRLRAHPRLVTPNDERPHDAGVRQRAVEPHARSRA